VLVAGLVACFLVCSPALLDAARSHSHSSVVEVLLRPFVEVVANPARLVLGTPSFEVEIAPECSGYEGVGCARIRHGVAVVLEAGWPLSQALLLLPVACSPIWF